jgi:hypothetical protein
MTGVPVTDLAAVGAEDVLRYAFSQAPGRDFVAPLGPSPRPLTTTFGSLPEQIALDRTWDLPWGTTDLLADAPYPERCAAVELSVEERWQHALVTAFGLQRREPSNLFNDHRSCASVRSRFPVHAFVHTEDEAWILDAYRHGLLPVGDASPHSPSPGPLAVALAGRYTHLPSLYGRLRGPLVELELGISLRSLFVALELFGLPGDLQLPGPGTRPLMAQLALNPQQWSAPLGVTLGGFAAPWAAGGGDAPLARDSETRAAGGGGFLAPPVNPAAGGDDPTLEEIVAVNRTALAVAGESPADRSRGSAAAIPDNNGRAQSLELDWAELIWRRNSGRMPRQLAGVSGRRQRVSSAAVTEAVAWLDQPPPTALLRETSQHIKVSACVADAEGFQTGWYRLHRREVAAGRQDVAAGRQDVAAGRQDVAAGRHEPAPTVLELVHPDRSLPARLEACYGHGLGPEVGCAVRHASLIWLMSANVPALIDAIGPGGWTLAQYVCGWMAHGLCLAAAAHGMYARPNRAFDEILLHPVVGMRPGEIVLLSVVSGAGRFLEPMLDLRT